MSATEELTEREANVATEPISDYELERGKPMPSKNHSKLQTRIGHLLLKKYEEAFDVFSELSLVVEGETKHPDICVFPKSPNDWLRDEIKVTQMPLLAIEIFSPRQVWHDLETKVRSLLDAGAKSCWVVFPSLRAVAVYLPNQLPKVFTSGEIRDEQTGVSLTIEEIFR
ncbi:MAG: Uma2 family endonuclease [Chloroherpetonaceae bacterium]|nr:Uma2 family endonuclease [Chloroherpetonaceae bacterium]MDW8438266.1 Uma2 family endonuclease [Chloroherpetonaceae bacterium]